MCSMDHKADAKYITAITDAVGNNISTSRKQLPAISEANPFG